MVRKSVIEVFDLSKRYHLGQTSLKSMGIKPMLKNPRSNNADRVQGNIFWALQEVNFSVPQGEILGIIGKNGAGKSTLLKILSRITMPTSGEIRIKGRVASLLEVGTGFHPELTGLENIYLNGAILGMTKFEIKSHLNEIIDFSGITNHINTPVKRYSSGMKVRLGFAVAAHLNPEILIIDEVLAVGDAEFQSKCLGKMRDVTRGGRTVLFVSHSMAAIKALCTSAILLKEGRIEAYGDTSSVIDKYLIPENEEKSKGQRSWTLENGPGSEECVLLSVRIFDEKNNITSIFYTSKPIRIEITYQVHQRLSGSRMLIQIKDMLDNIAFTSTNEIDDNVAKQPGTYITSCIIHSNLLNQGRYQLVIHMGIPNVKPIINNITALSFETILMGNNGSLQEKWPGIVAPMLKWQTIKQN